MEVILRIDPSSRVDASILPSLSKLQPSGIASPNLSYHQREWRDLVDLKFRWCWVIPIPPVFTVKILCQRTSLALATTMCSSRSRTGRRGVGAFSAAVAHATVLFARRRKNGVIQMLLTATRRSDCRGS